ncbi:hypothetical protein KUM42_12105 [Modestobacter sp. L9-4]|uniref:hypothetical protein n=1 Tax=Modestobacter sp. L9-4 TaxID=2851567 RepID=UPI001C763159|nr:hypothetical protein [Modestobacter sp. L9-4]QXG74630.1 hypothetical protein KUM42_12105 [Modestobacter sp. L9-4]
MPVIPTDATAFVDSVGINTHWGYTDTPYGFAYDAVRDRLVESGIKHVRGDTIRADDLYRYGIKSTILVDKAVSGLGDPGAQVIALLPAAGRGAVAAIEGPNEADLFWTRSQWTYKGLTFPAALLAWQADLWGAVRAQASLKNVPVIGPAMGNTYWSGGHPLPAGSLQGTSDFGNMHPYPRDNPFSMPRSYAGIRDYYRESNFPSGTLDEYPINFKSSRLPYGSKPMMATETGYSTWRLGQSERVQGLYLPRVLMENYRLGISRTYLYELLDEFEDAGGENKEAHFGLLRRDLTPKPAFTAVKNLLKAVSPRVGVSGEPLPLPLSLQVTPPLGYDAQFLHHIMLTRSTSEHVLVLWHEVSSNDVSTLAQNPPRPPIELRHPAMRVTVNLGRPCQEISARRFDDQGELRPQGLGLRQQSVDLMVDERMTLVFLRV